MYRIEVTEENVARVFNGDEIVFTTRPCRLSVQAQRLAQDWIDSETGKVYDGITLEVDDLVIDPNTLF